MNKYNRFLLHASFYHAKSVCFKSVIQSGRSLFSRVPDERFLRICLNGITHTCMIHRWNEENKPHRNKDVVAMYCGHVFLKLGSKVKI